MFRTSQNEEIHKKPEVKNFHEYNTSFLCNTQKKGKNHKYKNKTSYTMSNTQYIFVKYYFKLHWSNLREKATIKYSFIQN